MTYVVGNANAKKNNYTVYLRPHGVNGGGSDDDWTSGFVNIDIADLNPNDGETDAEWAADGTFLNGEFGAIGELDEKPSIKGSEGEERGTASGDSITISEMIESSMNQIEVTKGNYEALRALAANGPVDILFYDAENAAASVGARKMNMKVFLSIAGNELNTIELSFKKEAGDLDDYFSFITMDA
jgi:hypothetical protein